MIITIINNNNKNKQNLWHYKIWFGLSNHLRGEWAWWYKDHRFGEGFKRCFGGIADSSKGIKEKAHSRDDGSGWGQQNELKNKTY